MNEDQDYGYRGNVELERKRKMELVDRIMIGVGIVSVTASLWGMCYVNKQTNNELVSIMKEWREKPVIEYKEVVKEVVVEVPQIKLVEVPVLDEVMLARAVKMGIAGEKAEQAVREKEIEAMMDEALKMVEEKKLCLTTVVVKSDSEVSVSKVVGSDTMAEKKRFWLFNIFKGGK